MIADNRGTRGFATSRACNRGGSAGPSSTTRSFSSTCWRSCRFPPTCPRCSGWLGCSGSGSSETIAAGKERVCSVQREDADRVVTGDLVLVLVGDSGEEALDHLARVRPVVAVVGVVRRPHHRVDT